MFTKQQYNTTLKLSIALCLCTLVINYRADATWEPPLNAPPISNFTTPLHEGVEDQVKIGALRVAGLTSDRVILAPTAFAPASVPANILLWIGGVARANDLCLNSNPTSCLQGLLEAKKVVFTGHASVSAGDKMCHPGGMCVDATSAPDTYLVMPVPFAMTLKNLSVYTQTPLITPITCEVAVIKFIGGCGNLAHQDTPACTLQSGANSCTSPGNSSGTVSPGDCLGVSLTRGGGNCPAEISWTFEGYY